MSVETVYEGLPDLIPSDAVNLIALTDEDAGREHLSYSAIGDLLACPQKYAYRREQNLEPITKSPALSMGKAFQLGIEHQDPKYAYLAMMSDPSPVYGQEGHDRRLIQAVTVQAACRLYLATFPSTEDSIREYGYRVRLRNPWTGAYSRTFDLLGYADELRDCGQHYGLVENKLVGQITETQIKRLPLDRQVAMEAYGVWRATGKQVSEISYRYTRKPSIKQRKGTKNKPGETVEEFCERLEADYEERPEFYLTERNWYRSTEDLVRTEAELWEWAHQVREARRQHLFPRNTSHCTDFGGCDFLPLCLGDPDAPSLYQERTKKEDEVEPSTN